MNKSKRPEAFFHGPVPLLLRRSTRRTVRKSLLEEVQELEAQAVDPGAAVLRDASSRRYIHSAGHPRRPSNACEPLYYLLCPRFWS